MKILLMVVLSSFSVVAQDAPVLTPLSTEEKLAIRDLQVRRYELQQQLDNLPKVISQIQEQLNGLVASFQKSHKAEDAWLGNDLVWVPNKPTVQSATKPMPTKTVPTGNIQLPTGLGAAKPQLGPPVPVPPATKGERNER